MNHLALILLFWLATTGVGVGADWPVLHGNRQGVGFYPEFPNGRLRLVWHEELWRELTGPRPEVIVGAGCAFRGTYADGALFFVPMDRFRSALPRCSGIRFRGGWPSLFFVMAAVFCVDSHCAQNIVMNTDSTASQQFTANPVRLTDMDVGEFLFSTLKFSTAGSAASEKLNGYFNLPWCKGDLFFIGKSVYALWAAGGRPWITL